MGLISGNMLRVSSLVLLVIVLLHLQVATEADEHHRYGRKRSSNYNKNANINRNIIGEYRRASSLNKNTNQNSNFNMNTNTLYSKRLKDDVPPGCMTESNRIEGIRDDNRYGGDSRDSNSNNRYDRVNRDQNNDNLYGSNDHDQTGNNNRDESDNSRHINKDTLDNNIRDGVVNNLGNDNLYGSIIPTTTISPYNTDYINRGTGNNDEKVGIKGKEVDLKRTDQVGYQLPTRRPSRHRNRNRNSNFNYNVNVFRRSNAANRNRNVNRNTNLMSFGPHKNGRNDGDSVNTNPKDDTRPLGNLIANTRRFLQIQRSRPITQPQTGERESRVWRDDDDLYAEPRIKNVNSNANFNTNDMMYWRRSQNLIRKRHRRPYNYDRNENVNINSNMNDQRERGGFKTMYDDIPSNKWMRTHAENAGEMDEYSNQLSRRDTERRAHHRGVSDVIWDAFDLI